MPETGERCRILIADDQLAVRILMEKCLTRMGHEVTCARDGQEALSLVQQVGTHVDLLVVDMRMPKLTGAEVLQHVRLSHPDLPVILSSAIDEHEADRIVRDDSAASFLQKAVRSGRAPPGRSRGAGRRDSPARLKLAARLLIRPDRCVPRGSDRLSAG